MSQLLNERWSETKEALLEGLQGNRRASMAVCLENTRKYLAESATAGATSSGNIATLNRVILPVIRRVMPTVIANEIIGVQPMTGSSSQIFSLRASYNPLSKYKFSRAKWYEANHRYEDYDAIMEWCTEQFGPKPRRPDAWTRWTDIHIDRIRFRDEQDYVLFMLRWG